MKPVLLRMVSRLASENLSTAWTARSPGRSKRALHILVSISSGLILLCTRRANEWNFKIALQQFTIQPATIGTSTASGWTSHLSEQKMSVCGAKSSTLLPRLQDDENSITNSVAVLILQSNGPELSKLLITSRMWWGLTSSSRSCNFLRTGLINESKSMPCVPSGPSVEILLTMPMKKPFLLRILSKFASAKRCVAQSASSGVSAASQIYLTVAAIILRQPMTDRPQ